VSLDTRSLHEDTSLLTIIHRHHFPIIMRGTRVVYVNLLICIFLTPSDFLLRHCIFSCTRSFAGVHLAFVLSYV
jgi:hypothetical protein